MHVGYEMVDNQRGAIIMLYPTSASGIIVFIKNGAAQNIKKSSRLYLKKQDDFQLVFNFEQTRSATIFGEHGIISIMAHFP